MCACARVFLWVRVAVGCEASSPRGRTMNCYIHLFRVILALYRPCHCVSYISFQDVNDWPLRGLTVFIGLTHGWCVNNLKVLFQI